MTQIVSRTYHSSQQAADAVAKLKSTGFSDDVIHMVPPDTQADHLDEAIAHGGVVKAYVPHYAEAIRRGETLVSVRAAFGCAATVTRILGEFGPTGTGLDAPGYESHPVDPAAPLSSKLGWRVLIDNPTPLSSWLGWRTISPNRPARKPPRDLVDNPAPLSKMFGMRILSDRAAPLSSRLGWRLLLDNPAPLSSRLGWRTLTGSQEAPSKRFGLSLLSSDPTPSATLSNDPAPLSRLLGWRVLSRPSDKDDR